MRFPFSGHLETSNGDVVHPKVSGFFDIRQSGEWPPAKAGPDTFV